MSPHLDLISQLNRNAAALLSKVRSEMESLGVKRLKLSNGTEVFDFGSCDINPRMSELLAGVCMAGLADISLDSNEPVPSPEWMSWVKVKTDDPLAACMAAQYAGWPLSVDDFFAMCSGPARAVRGREEVLQEYDLIAESDSVVAVLETAEIPDSPVAEAIAKECKVSPDQVQLCVAPTSSPAGTAQIVARSVETAIHKLHELKFDLRSISSGTGHAPLPPQAGDDMTALGWTNDSILYGGIVELTVDCEDSVIEEIGPKVPSSSSSDFGTPFLEIFERFERDFYKIDKMLFSPAKVIFQSTRSGNTFEYGEPRFDILESSWGIEK